MVTAKDLKELSSSLNILYAEDEKILRDSMVPILEKFFKSVSIAKNGQEALYIFKKGNIDIILTDINMPIMDGVEFIANMNKLENNPITIVLSAHDESLLLKTLINMEVNTFLNKPVEKNALIKALYKNCSIITNKRLLASYSKQLEEENELMRRKNIILEQKLKQLASQTNINESMNKSNERSETVNNNKIDNGYYKTLMQDDRDELLDLSEELDKYIMMMFQNESLHKNYMNKLSNVYAKYASVLNSYGEFYDISSYLHNFAITILTLEEKFLKDIKQTGIYFESLQLTLETYRQNVWEKEAKNPRFYNASLKNDIKLIIDFLEDKEAQENEIEFF